MVVVPLLKPVTKPVLLILATPVLDESHGRVTAGNPDPVSCEVLPLQNVRVPLMVGLGYTVIDKVVGVAHCPAVGVKV